MSERNSKPLRSTGSNLVVEEENGDLNKVKNEDLQEINSKGNTSINKHDFDEADRANSSEIFESIFE